MTFPKRSSRCDVFSAIGPLESFPFGSILVHQNWYTLYSCYLVGGSEIPKNHLKCEKNPWSTMGFVDLRSPQRDVPLSGLVFAASLGICCFWLGGPMGNERWSKVTKMKDGKGLWTCFSNIRCIIHIYIHILHFRIYIIHCILFCRIIKKSHG